MSLDTRKKGTAGNTYNSRFKSIKAELIKTDTEYAFTINPEKQFETYGFNYYQEFMKYMIGKLGKLNNCKMKLFPEVSPIGRLHLHGTIIILNVLSFYLTDIHLLQEIGAFEIDTISDVKIWETYITKQQLLFKEHFQIKTLELPTCIITKPHKADPVNRFIRYVDKTFEE